MADGGRGRSPAGGGGPASATSPVATTGAGTSTAGVAYVESHAPGAATTIFSLADHVLPEDIQELAPFVLSHRIWLGPHAASHGLSVDADLEAKPSGLTLPVNIAFVPPSLHRTGSSDPLFYVTELYGKVRVVSNDYVLMMQLANAGIGLTVGLEEIVGPYVERGEGKEVFRKIVNVSSTSGMNGNAGQAELYRDIAESIGLQLEGKPARRWFKVDAGHGVERSDGSYTAKDPWGTQVRLRG